MFSTIFWLYLVNSVLLINHEIDSAYWHEWKMFKLPGGISFFLVIHFLLIFLVLYGMVLVSQQTTTGMVFSLCLSLSGIFGFGIHAYHLKKGREEFRLPVSLFILAAILPVSLAQLGFTIHFLAGVIST